MAKQSAGILVYRMLNQQMQFLLVHPGGPFFKNKHDGVWSIPKGEFADGEEPLAAARREFEEETGFAISGGFMPLRPVKSKSGKTIYAWAVKGDLDAGNIASNTFTMEWPPKSGKMQAFAEVDQAGWFDFDMAVKKINAGQVGLLEEVAGMIG